MSGAVELGATPLGGPTLSVHRLATSAATTNPQFAKNGRGRLYKISAFNASAAVKWLKLYNKAGAPTVGTDTPVLNLPLAVGVNSIDLTVFGMQFTLGIGYGITGAAPDLDTTALAVGDILQVQLVYL